MAIRVLLVRASIASFVFVLTGNDQGKMEKERSKGGNREGENKEWKGGRAAGRNSWRAIYTNADCSPQEFDSCTILPLQDHGILEENIFFLTLITCPSGAIHQPCDSFRVSECGI